MHNVIKESTVREARLPRLGNTSQVTWKDQWRDSVFWLHMPLAERKRILNLARSGETVPEPEPLEQGADVKGKK